MLDRHAGEPNIKRQERYIERQIEKDRMDKVRERPRPPKGHDTKQQQQKSFTERNKTKKS